MANDTDPGSVVENDPPDTAEVTHLPATEASRHATVEWDDDVVTVIWC